ncbi:MAG: metal-sensitive transcriptional regulator [Chloroflexi bacterium]|nr:metal-sensitive transcriptional regulator [Chloroflexota bacterium]
MLDDVKDDALKRLNYLAGHLDGVRRMIEADAYCPDVLKQTYAVRKAISKLETRILEGHLNSCVAEGIRDGRQEQVVSELMELYDVANR